MMTTRRGFTRTTMWSIPAVAVAAAAPAVAASSGLTDLSVAVLNPPTDIPSGTFLLTSPLYKSDLKTVAVKASLSTQVVVTNVGSVPAINPTGTMDLQLVDYSTDVPVIGTEARKFHLASQTPGVALTDIAPLTWPGAGRNYSWTYSGTLLPGQSMTINLLYWVDSPFAHATAMQMLLSASVVDQTDGDSDDNDGRSNYIPSFAA